MICSEFTIFSQKWVCFSFDRPLEHNNLQCFFQELTKALSKARKSYENFVLMRHFITDINSPSLNRDNLDKLCTLFDLKNLITSITCITKNHRSTIDLILTNTRRSFQENITTEMGFSKFYQFISTYFKAHFTKLCPKTM